LKKKAMEKPKDNQEKTGCGRFILRIIIFYGIFCLLCFAANEYIPGGIDAVVGVVMFIIFTVLIIGSFEIF